MDNEEYTLFYSVMIFCLPMFDFAVGEEIMKRPANFPLVEISDLEHRISPDVSARRCNSKGRGSVYDPVFGICCHFCRYIQIQSSVLPLPVNGV